MTTCRAAKSIFVALVALLQIQWSGLALAENDDEALRRRFMDEYPNAALQLKTATSNLDLTIVNNEHWVPDGTVRRHIFIDGRTRGDVVQIDSPRPHAGIFGRAHILKDDIVYVFFQYSGSGPWVLVSQEPASREGVLESAIISNIDHFAFAAFSVTGLSLIPILSDPDNIREVTAVKIADHDKLLVEVEFDVPAHIYKNFKRGKVLLSPDNRWAIVRYDGCEFINANGTHVFMSGENSYENAESIVPETSTMKTEWKESGTEHGIDEYELTLNNVQKGVVGASSFDLDQFGMKNRPASRRWVWLVIMNVAIVLGILCAWYYVSVRHSAVG